MGFAKLALFHVKFHIKCRQQGMMILQGQTSSLDSSVPNKSGRFGSAVEARLVPRGQLVQAQVFQLQDSTSFDLNEAGEQFYPADVPWWENSAKNSICIVFWISWFLCLECSWKPYLVSPGWLFDSHPKDPLLQKALLLPPPSLSELGGPPLGCYSPWGLLPSWHSPLFALSTQKELLGSP